ncbi:MAG: CHAT domain-containing protein [Oscillatoria sp. SIO1A7]|nr:CHAT domain-containing protein [Oscillatoria sp. SIO1A7]
MKKTITFWILRIALALTPLAFCMGLTIAPSEALAAAHNSTREQTRLDDRASQGSSNPLELGKELIRAGRFAEAAAAWQEAERVYSMQGDKANLALSLSYLSLAYQEMAQWEEARAAIAKSLEQLQSSGEILDTILFAQALNTKASLLLATGDSQGALDTWKRSEEFYREAGDEIGVLGSQINRARALQSLGFYRRSQTLLQAAARELDSKPDSAVKASSLRSLGIALQTIGNIQAGKDILAQSLAVARRADADLEISTTLLSLGNAAVGIEDLDAALEYFQEAEKAAMNPLERLEAELNQLSVYVKLKQWQEALELAPQLEKQLGKLPASRRAIYSTIELADSLLEMESHEQPIDWQGINQLLAAAFASARSLQDTRAEAQVLVKWGELYAQNGQEEEAVELTRQSLSLAQSLQASDIVARSAWQLGRLRVRQGEKDEAIAAYTQAVNALQSLRSDLAAINPEVQFSFRESVEPVYRELVTLLLPPLNRDKNQKASQERASQENLKQARELIEALQLAELDDFFREACLDVEPVQIDRIDPSAAAVYPIILSDRLAVIVSSPGQPLRYYATPRSRDEVEEKLKTFISRMSPLYGNKERLSLARETYNWVLGQAEADGAFAGAETLVFVLDGILRSVPIAALHDGEKYLVEKYNLVLSPGLQLLETRSLTQESLSPIIAGMSEARQGFSALPAVALEVERISEQFPGFVIFNQNFTRTALLDKINKSPSRVIHLATHGQFSSKAEDTFLLTWDDRLNVQEIDELLQSREITGVGAIELLVLSACETAAGDDRAVLGLAGIAVKSGARSTLATLWRVRDESTALFMSEFYKQLQAPGISKAEAVRKAQLALLGSDIYDEPFFWAPFVLIGNWL